MSERSIMATLEKAIGIATQTHQGQMDKGGEPYILHPLRLMLRMKTEDEMIIAVLHDLLEDTTWTLEQLRSEGFTDEVVSAVKFLTRRHDESYDAFIERVKTNSNAKQVKIADVEDNMNIQRISKLSSKDTHRLEKYHKAWRKLTLERGV